MTTIKANGTSVNYEVQPGNVGYSFITVMFEIDGMYDFYKGENIEDFFKFINTKTR